MALRERRRVVALDAGAGGMLDDAYVDELAAEPALTLLCGRYEGFDERILEHFCSDRSRSGATCWPAASWRRWSSATPCCASCRARSATRSRRPRSRSARRWTARRSTRTTRGRPSGAAGRVPEVLLSGHHARIRAWRREQSQRARRARRRFAILRPPRRQRSCSRGFFFAMSTVIDSLERAQLRRVPQFQAGDRVRVHFQVIEGTRRRTQVFEGVVIKRQGEGVRETFTVRKQSFGVGVERTFPLHSPKIERIEVAARGDVRRAKLYYLRGRVGKRARVRERRYTGPGGGRRGRPAARSRGRGGSRGRRRGAGRGGRRAGARRGRGHGRPKRRRAPSRRTSAAEAAAAEVRGRRRREASVGAARARPASSSLLELVLIVAVALGLALGIQAFLVKPYRIPSESMVPTLEIGQRVLVNRIGGRFSDPKVGDIVVFHPPAGAEEDNTCGGGPPPDGQVCDKPTADKADVNFIKRVVAGPGDRISIRDGHVVLNGKLQKEPSRSRAGAATRATTRAP